MYKHVRILFLALLHQAGVKVKPKKLAELTGVSLREAQRDIKILPGAMRQAKETVDRYSIEKPEKTYSVEDVSELLGLNPYHVRLLARTMPVGERTGNSWRFSEADLERLRTRPGKRK
jgi:hypothetical protein